LKSDIRFRLNHLCESCYPFSLLSGRRASEAVDSLKVFELGPGEQITLRSAKDADLIYVLEGEVELQAEGEACLRLGRDETARTPYRLRKDSSPITVTPKDRALVCRADGEVLEYLLSWETLAAGEDAPEGDTHVRIATVRRSLAFRRLPLECVEEAFRRMSRKLVAAGTEVVRQGEPGDAFYMIEKGHAEVWQMGLDDDEPRLVAELGPGDTFGEEALVLKGARNATVRMVQEGSLLVLGSAVFDELFNKPMIQRVKASVAKAYLESGYLPLDVRYQEEFDEGHLPGSILIPLHELRGRVDELNPAGSYVAYCKSGGRSAVATLLLRQRGLNVVSLAGGLREYPFETVTA
jgi:CRP-like cAMP-binding protein